MPHITYTYNSWEMPPIIPPSLVDSGPPPSDNGSLVPPKPPPQQHFDQFIRFSTVHGCNQHTDRHTHHAASVGGCIFRSASD